MKITDEEIEKLYSIFLEGYYPQGHTHIHGVRAVTQYLPEPADWPLTRDAFASKGITTDEAAADFVSTARALSEEEKVAADFERWFSRITPSPASTWPSRTVAFEIYKELRQHFTSTQPTK